MQGQKRIIEPGKIVKEATAPEGGLVKRHQIVFNKVAQNTRDAFGVTEERRREILKKLVAVARIYPRYSIVAESFLNCDDRFTELERLYGLYILGRVSGAAGVLKQTGAKIRAREMQADQEIELLSLFSKNVMIEPLLMEAYRRIQ